jgi:curved DNA-binding protein CbpA
MNKMENLYSVLGVPKDATPEAIKSAYRKLAQKWHPDRRGGDNERFTVIGIAYEILSDEGKRKRYDETGLIDKELDMETMCTNVIEHLFEKIIQMVDFHGDIVGFVASELEKEAGNKSDQLNKFRAELKKLSAFENRVIKKQGDNLFSLVLANKKAVISGHINDIEKTMQIINMCLDMIKDYTDERPTSPHDQNQYERLLDRVVRGRAGFGFQSGL